MQNQKITCRGVGLAWTGGDRNIRVVKLPPPAPTSESQASVCSRQRAELVKFVIGALILDLEYSHTQR